GKTRIGATVSVPSESDCLFLEKPPVVPPLKIFYVTSKPGRPKKNAAKPAAPVEKETGGFRDELPSDVSVDVDRKSSNGWILPGADGPPCPSRITDLESPRGATQSAPVLS